MGKISRVFLDKSHSIILFMNLTMLFQSERRELVIKHFTKNFVAKIFIAIAIL